MITLGLDVGGTKIEGVAVNASGSLLARVVVPTDATSAESSVASIVAAVQAARVSAGAAPDEVDAIGLGIPGKVEDGIVSLAVNLSLTSYPLARMLSEKFGVPVAIENDVRAAALGVYAWVREQPHLAQPIRSIVYMSIGTGISAGVILNGRLYRGSNGMAGEVGHALFTDGGERCKCGMDGCFETVAAGPAIARQAVAAATEAVCAGEQSILGTCDPLSAECVFTAAASGDRAARAVVERVGRAVSRAVYNLVMAYDVDLVCLGGGVTHAGEAFFAPVRKEMAEMSAQSPLAREMLARNNNENEKVILIPPEAGAAWRGVIALARGVANGN